MRILGLGLGALAIGGCAGSGAPPQDLAFAASDYAGARLAAILRRAFIPEVNELTRSLSRQWSEESNATIVLSMLDDWREKYAEVAQDRKGEDIAELFGNSPHLYSDRLVDVSELAEEVGAGSGGWISAAVDAARVDGVWRAVPWAYTGHAINFRVGLLDDVGVEMPRTYDDLLEAATRLRDAGLPRAGFTMSHAAPNDSANLAYSMLWSFGGQEVDKTGKRVVLDSSGTREALRFYRELAEVSDRRALTFTEGGNNDAFLDGTISMTQNASSIYWRALNEFPDIAADMDHVRYPSGPNGAHQLLELNSLAVMKHSQNTEAAIDWIRFITQPEQIRLRAASSLAFFSPPLTDFLDDPAMPWNTDKRLAGMKGLGDGGHMSGWPAPATKEASLVYRNSSIVNMFLNVAIGSQSVTEAVNTASHELRRVYET